MARGVRWGIAAAVALSVVAPVLLDLPAPIAWISLAWSLAAAAAIPLFHSRVLRWTLGVFFLATLSLCVVEGGLWLASSDRGHEALRTEGARITRPHSVLGRALRPNQRVEKTRYYGDETVFSVAYTTDERSQRLSSNGSPAPDRTSVLFFGGSYTFGDGVDDAETMPYRVGVRSGEQYRVYNFGVSGYGPHQMLAAIEHGIVEDVVAETPRFAVYQGVPHHVYRAVGATPWGRGGPRYVVGADGVRFVGAFAADSTLLEWARGQLDKSLLYNAAFGSSRRLESGDYELFGRIVAASRDGLQARYPGIEFHVLLWEEPEDPDGGALRQSLLKQDIAVHPMAEILGVSGRAPPEFMLSPHDAHPNALAHDRIAEYVVSEILREPTSPRGRRD